MVYLSAITSRWGMVAVSYTLYVLVQIYPAEIALPPPWADAIRFNPFAWQFLFFLGVALGSRSEDKFGYLPRGKAVVGAILVALTLCSYIKISSPPLDHWHLPPDALPWGKTTLEPMRLLHFVLTVQRGFGAAS